MRRGVIQGHCPVVHGRVFHAHAERAVGGSVWSENAGGVASATAIGMFTPINGRRIVNCSSTGADFTRSGGIMTGGTFTVCATTYRSSYASADRVARDKTGGGSATALLYPFKTASNEWGFFRDSSENTYETATANIGTFANWGRVVVTFDGSTDAFTVRYNEASGSGTTTAAAGNTTAATTVEVGRNAIPIREVLAFNRVLTSGEIDVIQRYQKYDAGA